MKGDRNTRIHQTLVKWSSIVGNIFVIWFPFHFSFACFLFVCRPNLISWHSCWNY